MSIVIGILTFVLILISLFLILIVLVQRPRSDSGLGATLGGETAEATFGSETGNVLTRATIVAAVAFFVLSLMLYLAHLHKHKGVSAAGETLPTVVAPATPAPAPVALPAAPEPAAPVKP